MNSSEKHFGTLPGGEEVHLYTVSNEAGYELSVTNYGGIITSFKAPDRDGEVAELTLGFETLEEYLPGHPYYGATIGRVANRTKSAGFAIANAYYPITPHPSKEVHLHGGLQGFDKKLWKAELLSPGEGVEGVELRYLSPDGDEGYPGNLSVTVTITLSEDNQLAFDYLAETDQATPVNLTNHTYWNLAGGGTVLDHWVRIHSSTLVETDSRQLPTGRLLPVDGTPFDLRTLNRVGERIEEVRRPEAGGFDDCYLLDGWDMDPSLDDLPRAAEVRELESGRVMEVRTSYPGLQFYTGNKLTGQRNRNGRFLEGHDALCLETQFLPDSVHHPSFPNTILEPGELYHHRTVHTFSTT
ncbi:MAG: aldose epimerase family protein [Spirochaetaceae bacterium]